MRHGVRTRTGIVIDTAELGSADELRNSQTALDEAQAKLHSSTSSRTTEQLIPGWAEENERLDEPIRADTEHAPASWTRSSARSSRLRRGRRWPNIGSGSVVATRTDPQNPAGSERAGTTVTPCWPTGGCENPDWLEPPGRRWWSETERRRRDLASRARTAPVMT